MIHHAIRSFFSEIDECLKRELQTDHVEKPLMDAYTDFWAFIKEKSGNSGGFTGLSEYLFFRFMGLYLETKLGLSFSTCEKTKDTRIFEDEDLIISHGGKIRNVSDTLEAMNTDMVVFQKRPGGVITLLAAYELKIYFSTPEALKNDLDIGILDTGVMCHD